MTSFNLPAFVWMFVIGTVACFAWGFCLNMGGKDEAELNICNEALASAVISAAFGVGTVIACLRFSVTIPQSFFWKIGLFALSVIAMVLLTLFFCGVSSSAGLLAVSIKKKEDVDRSNRTR